MLSVISQNPKPKRSSCLNNFPAKPSNSFLGLLPLPPTPLFSLPLCVCVLENVIVFELMNVEIY